MGQMMICTYCMSKDMLYEFVVSWKVDVTHDNMYTLYVKKIHLKILSESSLYS
jgi:hypothetical protein